MTNNQNGFVIIVLLLFLLHSINPSSSTSAATDTINTTQILRDNTDSDTDKPAHLLLVSPAGKFELGFFTPAAAARSSNNSSNRYLGIWFGKITELTVVWVANRDSPITGTSGVLRLLSSGLLVLTNGNDESIIWSSNFTITDLRNPVVQLLDSGNLVVRDRDDVRPENFVWQSFDYPTDTYLPGMNLGWNFVTGRENYLSAWKSKDDPATGEFNYHIDPTGYPQIVLRRGQAAQTRIGPWNGISFPGPPNPTRDPTYRLTFTMDEKKLYYRSDPLDPSLISRYMINQSGIAQRWMWADTRGWVLYFTVPADVCDTYKLCGAYGSCNVGGSPTCDCLDRFVPKDPSGWARADWLSGCVRRTNLSCEGDRFLKYSGIKLPDAKNSWHNASMTLQECRDECLRNCSCLAYAQLDIRKGTGCLIWSDDLVDIRTLSVDGQDLYIRMASSESDPGGKMREILLASLTSVLSGVLIIGLSLFLYARKRKKDSIARKGMFTSGSQTKDSELPFFDLPVILRATNHFSEENKLGEGGFGPVYKGMLDGQEIAAKRLSKESRQGLNELKNEIIFIAKLQHRNLVRLLGCCIDGEESILIYEYVPNKSLDVILFDKANSMLLDWEKRFNIISGIARGLLYLHEDSRLRIIHRDLKASNILLDSDMNPKISDFGLARSFLGNEIEAKTHRVVGTYGYMSPEYAIDGLFSIKSDVFSFGVLVLEIVSGKRNRGFSHSNHSLNLLGHAWTLHGQGRSMELVDTSLDDQYNSSQVLRSIEVDLLCVQQNLEDRPSMSSVVLMLGNEGEIPQAKHPGFFYQRDVLPSHNSPSTNAASSTNEVTVTMLEPR